MANNLDVGMKCIKYMIFITNFMFVMIGFLLISVGSTVACIYGDFEAFMEDHYFSPASMFIAIGIIIFFVSLFGCLGALRESTCLVNIYALFLSIILILEIAVVIAAYVMRSDVYEYVEIRMNNTISEFNENEYARESWDFLQNNLQCCGIYSYSDWYGIYNSSSENITFPESCYRRYDTIFESGCLSRLQYIISECAFLIGTGGICVAIVQALGVLFAIMLGKSIRRIKTEEERKRQENRQRMYAQLARGNDEKPTPVLYTAEEFQA